MPRGFLSILKSLIDGDAGVRKVADDPSLVAELLLLFRMALADGQKHGYAILKEVESRTEGRVQLSTGTLYGIIKRLLADGLIADSANGSTDRRRAYRLTPFGRQVALAETARMRELVDAARAKNLTARPARS